MNTGAFEQFFGTLDDPRQMAKVTHEFTDILFLVVCASIAGAKGWKILKTSVSYIFNGSLIKAYSRMVYPFMTQ